MSPGRRWRPRSSRVGAGPPIRSRSAPALAGSAVAYRRGGAVHAAVRFEVFVVAGVDGRPAESLIQILGDGPLDEVLFGEGRDVHPPRSSRHGANAVERDAGITGDEDEPLGLGLGNQHAVERIAVMRRKGARLLCMMERNGQRLEPLCPELGLEIVRRLQLPMCTLDGDLPAADHTDEYLVSGVLDSGAGGTAQLFGFGERPQDGVGVQKQAQSYRFSSGSTFES